MFSSSVNKTQVEQEETFGDASGDGVNQVYAETQDVAKATVTVHSSHQYEDVLDVARAGDGDYQITLCAAYGVGGKH